MSVGASCGVVPGIQGKPAAPSIDSRNIDELIKFIEGTDKQKKSSSAKKGTARSNPKRRELRL